MTGLRLEIARRQIEFARGYTGSLVSDLADEDWYRRPPGAPTHVAWQLGHLAMAQYGLALFRQRGRRASDAELMSAPFRKLFAKGSVPADETAGPPSPAEIRDVLTRVHATVLDEMEGPDFADGLLDTPVDEPHAGYATRFGALLFCAAHEMLHAGQIGLIRRLLGKAPLR